MKLAQRLTKFLRGQIVDEAMWAFRRDLQETGAGAQTKIDAEKSRLEQLVNGATTSNALLAVWPEGKKHVEHVMGFVHK